VVVVDACFSEPRLAQIYDALDGSREDLGLYLGIADELAVSSVLDVGCGTGVLACALAERGVEVVGVDPAEASLAVARGRPGADRVPWMTGGADAYDGPPVDLVTMTGNVVQVFVTDEEWSGCLRVCGAALRPGGRLVFEARDPARRGWEAWTPECTKQRVPAPGGGTVEAWCEVTEVALPLVTFRWTYVFDRDSAVLTSDSTLRFRDRSELTAALDDAGFVVAEVRDAPDRPGAEFVFVARRAAQP
jgi:SAM-dependent methyltransferase